MENFILKLVATICVSIITFTIILTRKDDIDISALCVAVIFEILSLITIFFGADLLSALLIKIM